MIIFMDIEKNIEYREASLLPLRSVRMSNFDKDLHYFIMLIQRRHENHKNKIIMLYSHAYICINYT